MAKGFLALTEDRVHLPFRQWRAGKGR
jgi:hypothetical protein